jgi:hypothetical protein
VNSQLKRIVALAEASGRNRVVSIRLVGVSKEHARRSRAWRLAFALPQWQQRLCVRLAFAGSLFANRILPGYVSPNDAGKYEMVVDHDGPASYINASAANSGEQINASDFGLGGFESVGVDSLVNTVATAGGSLQGVVEVSLGSIVTTNTGLALGATAVASAVLHWFEAATRSTEFPAASNLSTSFVRLRVMAV